MGKLLVSYLKDTDATDSFYIDWRQDLGHYDGAIHEEWVVPDGIEHLSDSYANGIATIRLSGGTPGERYRLRHRLETKFGCIYYRTLLVDIVEY